MNTRMKTFAAAVCGLLTLAAVATEPVPLFDGSDSYVDLGKPAALQIPSNEPFTVEGWMLFNSLSTRDMLYCKSAGRTAVYTYMLGFADGKLSAYNTVTAWRGNFPVVRETGRWYHVAFSFDGVDMAFYLDGALLGTTAFSFSNTDAHTVKIGGYSASADIDGSMSDVRVWDRARSQTEIQNAMSNRLTGAESGLLGYWPLNEGVGVIAYDRSSGSSHGALIGADWTRTETLPLGPSAAGFDHALPFQLVNIETGSPEFTNSNEVDVADFPIPGECDRYQITHSAATDGIDPEAWTATNDLPTQLTFDFPAGDSNVVFYAWFTNTAATVTVRRAAANVLRYTTAAPVPVACATYQRGMIPGYPAVLNPEQFDLGSTGGESGGLAIPIHALSLNLVSGPATNATPDEPVVTLAEPGAYEVELVVVNAAGNVATSAVCEVEVTVFERATFIWTGASGADWHNPLNWDQQAVPVDGAAVVLGSGSVLLADATADLASFTMGGGTLTFSNWTTRLSADAVEIEGNAVVTLPPAYPDGAMSNRVWFSCETFSLGASATVNTDQKGYQGGSTGTIKDGHGPGAGNSNERAASHGGQGAIYSALYPQDEGHPYGDPAAPLYPGSGGCGSSWATGGSGGGAVRIEAAGAVVIDGVVSANAANGRVRSGGGSGGSVYITCGTIGGAGLVSAAGGHSDYTSGGCGGGGGRIAVIYDPAAQAALPVPGILFHAQGGTVCSEAEPGTLYFPDTRLLDTEIWSHRGQWMVPGGFASLARDTQVISNGWLRFPEDGFFLTITNALILVGDGAVAAASKKPYRNAGRLDLVAGRLAVGGDLVLTNTATFSILDGTNTHAVSVAGDLALQDKALVTLNAAPTNGVAPECGGLLAVTGRLALAGGSWLEPVSHWTNGGSVFMEAGSVSIDADSGINADARGYGNEPKTYSAINFGPGKGTYSYGGGGYGGRGGNVNGGRVYGSAPDPREPGSAGADQAANGGYGGGLVRLTVTGGVTINGTITANGQDGGIINSSRRGSGGSGGGVYIDCAWIAGANGTVTADGGLGHNGSNASGGGGGGRIAVHYDPAQQDALPLPDISFSAAGGRGTGTTFINRDDIDGDLGTLYFTDSRFLTEPIRHSGVWLAPGLASEWAVHRLVVSNRWFRFPDAGQVVRVSGDVLVTDNGRLDLCNGELLCGGAVALTNSGTLTLFGDLPGGAAPRANIAGNLSLSDGSYLNVYAVPTNETDVCGARVEVGGRLTLGTNCWVWPFSNPTNSGSPRFYVNDLDVADPVSGFNANGRGCAGGPPIGESPGYGVGGGRVQRSGGGYGGNGGPIDVGLPYGPANGSLTHPADPGSGGAGTSAGLSPGGAGGGLIWIYAERSARIEGQCVAEGVGSQGLGYNGGGSGGGIYVRCSRLSGAGHLSVRGGNGGTHSLHGGGSGAGGRIALWRMVDTSSFTSNIVAGTAIKEVRTGEVGTYFVGTLPAPGTVLLLR